MGRLREQPPAGLAGDRRSRAPTTSPPARAALPPTDGLRYYLADGSRVIVRPSGTEPKLKGYLEVIEPVPDRPALAAAGERASARLAAIRDAMHGLTAL